MEFGDYWLVRPTEIKKLSKLKPKSRALLKKLGKLGGGKERWVPLPLDDGNVAKVVDVALHFNNYEWSAWDFDVYAKGKCVLSVCFGENDECGISEDMNGVQGSVEKAAAVLDIDPKKLAKVVESEDMEKLAKLVGFDVLPITPTDIENL
jgi:hypothetical protein